MFTENVVITGQCYNMFKPVLEQWESIISTYLEDDYKATITSANDGSHSTNSMHYKNKAVDIRIKDIDTDLIYRKKNLEACVYLIGCYYKYCVFILHLYDGKNHLHIQKGTDNIINPDSGLGENKNVFIK
jgi:hypothetical protein